MEPSTSTNNHMPDYLPFESYRDQTESFINTALNIEHAPVMIGATGENYIRNKSSGYYTFPWKGSYLYVCIDNSAVRSMDHQGNTVIVCSSKKPDERYIITICNKEITEIRTVDSEL